MSAGTTWKALQGEKLEDRARELGVDVSGEGKTHSVSGASKRAPDHVLQQRVFEAERTQRETKLFWIACLSAIFSAVSALIAVIAVSLGG